MKTYRDETTGLHCMIRTSRFAGALLGYVGVEEGHPAYGCNTDHDRLRDIEVHGGLSWCGRNPDDDADPLWYLGFDCAHAWDIDYAPGDFDPRNGVANKDESYVRAEIASLAAQVAKL